MQNLHAILVLDYHEAKFFNSDLKGTHPETLKTIDPKGHLRHMHSKPDNDGKYSHVHQQWFAEITEKLAGANSILIMHHGKGHSNVLTYFLKYLAKHENQLLSKVDGAVYQENHITEPQILAEARKFYDEEYPRFGLHRD